MTQTDSVPFYKSRWPRGYDSIVRFMRDPLRALSVNAQRGDISRTEIGGQSIYFINTPDYVKDVLVNHQRDYGKGDAVETLRWTIGNGLLTAEGDFWLKQRRLIQPEFHRQRIAAYGDTMAAYSERIGQRWRDGAELDMHREMMHLTLEIVVKCLFDLDIESGNPELNEALETLMRMGEFSRIPVPFARLMLKSPLPHVKRYHKAMAYIDAMMYGMIDERRATGDDHGDLLSMLLHTHGDDGEMSAKQIRDELLTFFLAGHETTALALTWTWYLLSLNPDVEQKLYAELDAVLAGRLPTAADVSQLRYTEMVLAESMRLYPPAYITSRLALKKTQIGDHTIPTGARVLMSPYTLHRHPRFWTEPERFDPERFTPDAKAARPKLAYMPFGAGPRQCIGEPFAWMEGIVILATLAQKWQMRHVPTHKVEAQPLVTLRLKNGMLMHLRQRAAVQQPEAVGAGVS